MTGASLNTLRNTQQVYHNCNYTDENIHGVILVSRDLTLWATRWKNMWLCHCVLQRSVVTKLRSGGETCCHLGRKSAQMSDCDEVSGGEKGLGAGGRL